MILLLFAEPGCESCEMLLPAIARRSSEQEENLNIPLVSRGTTAENLAKFQKLGVPRVLLQEDCEIAEAYDCPGGPAAVLIGADGLIRSELAMGAAAIEKLIYGLQPGATVSSE
jgi:hypothetical protein